MQTKKAISITASICVPLLHTKLRPLPVLNNATREAEASRASALLGPPQAKCCPPYQLVDQPNIFLKDFRPLSRNNKLQSTSLLKAHNVAAAKMFLAEVNKLPRSKIVATRTMMIPLLPSIAAVRRNTAVQRRPNCSPIERDRKAPSSISAASAAVRRSSPSLPPIFHSETQPPKKLLTCHLEPPPAESLTCQAKVCLSETGSDTNPIGTQRNCVPKHPTILQNAYI